MSTYLEHHLAFAVTRQPTFLSDPATALAAGYVDSAAVRTAMTEVAAATHSRMCGAPLVLTAHARTPHPAATTRDLPPTCSVRYATAHSAHIEASCMSQHSMCTD